jgi:hypothetical protein
MISGLRKWRWPALVALALVVAPASLAGADEAATKIAISNLEAGSLAAGDAALAAMVDRDGSNDDARFGLGMIRFVRAVERLSQGFYRYGLSPPRSMLIPILRLPVPVNAHPEPITYDDFRAILKDFVADLSSADQTLAAMGESEVKLPLDLEKIRYDANGDGTAAPNELLIAAIAVVTGMDRGDLPPSLVVAFDRGDAIWLRGYCNVLMAIGEFLLAYDWHESFDASAHLFFPHADTPFAKAIAEGEGLFAEASPVADAISFLHIRWPVGEPARMGAVRDHLKTVVALSRKSWDAIEVETDNDREWLPNPRQDAAVTTSKVNPDQLAAWRSMLDEADALLDGRRLMPHWRFDQGVNLKRVFEEPRPFDLILWITGPAALPYLEDGNTLSSEKWNRLVDAFEGSFGAYVVWFN